MSGGFDPALLELLVCPIGRTRLRWDEAASELVSDEAGLAYPIRQGVPVLLIEEARKIGDQLTLPVAGGDGEGDRA
ncbi:Trm112 family protein [Sphingomonas parva]|uniref:UPF0434 protein E2493_17490 n=1 Tax=Sphingomonas parva TaxID=2555898 RepID=A0A4Y8ZPB4_9SPHN|nr:Trm112 family protein [Sphingomonas parva]